jgi:hypothetical protein
MERNGDKREMEWRVDVMRKDKTEKPSIIFLLYLKGK